MNRSDLAPDPISLGYHDLFNQVGLPFEVTSKYGFAPDRISFDYYGTYDFWWLVLMFNGFVHPREVQVGMVIRLPSIKTVFASATRGEQIALP